jgi:hypothetical protein
MSWSVCERSLTVWLHWRNSVDVGQFVYSPVAMQKRGRSNLFSKGGAPRRFFKLWTDASQGMYNGTTVGKPCEVGHSCKSAPSHICHTFTEPSNSCDIICGHHFITWPNAYLESWPVSHLVLCFLYKFSLHMLADLKSWTVFVSYCTWAQVLIH